jgi:predicted small metal-binding protein
MDASGEQLKNQERLHFKCSDVVARNCDWQVSGNSEREIMPLIGENANNVFSSVASTVN